MMALLLSGFCRWARPRPSGRRRAVRHILELPIFFSLVRAQ